MPREPITHDYERELRAITLRLGLRRGVRIHGPHRRRLRRHQQTWNNLWNNLSLFSPLRVTLRLLVESDVNFVTG